MDTLFAVLRGPGRDPVVLDPIHTPPLTLSRRRFAEVANHIKTIDRLHAGLTTLYTLVQHHERAFNADPANDGLLLQLMGDGPGSSRVPWDLLNSCFDWYAIHACRYFQLRAFISDELSGEDDKHRVSRAKTYRYTVCGPVNKYRDKIAAHFAETDPRSEDNPADRFTSILPTLGVTAGRFYAGLLRGGKGGHNATHDIEWSLTDFHDNTLPHRIHSCSQD